MCALTGQGCVKLEVLDFVNIMFLNITNVNR